jgi:hypothetical protein
MDPSEPKEEGGVETSVLHPIIDTAPSMELPEDASDWYSNSSWFLVDAATSRLTSLS